jgi:hypothetical protein
MDSLDYGIISSPTFIENFLIETINVNNNLIIYNDSSVYSNSFLARHQENKAILFLECNNIEFRICISENETVIKKENNLVCYFILNILLFDNVVTMMKYDVLKFSFEQFELLYSEKFDELFEMWNFIDRSHVNSIKEYLQQNNIEFLQFINRFETLYIKRENNELSKDMLNFNRSQKDFSSEYINRFVKIAIYGAGQIGTILFEILKSHNVQIECFIDNYNLSGSLNGIPIIKSEDLIKNRDVNLIIVTATYDYIEIAKTLQSMTDKKIVSLRDLL